MPSRLIICLVLASLTVLASEPPMIPVGLDAYRMWERWPYQRIGARAYMRSTYDRRGGNESADASHFLYQLADDFNVTLDVEGKGILYFARYNHWHGSPWHYVVDGTDHIVQETSTANPNKPVEGSVFMPENLFPNPLTWTWSVTKGADLMGVPIEFERSFRMAYSRTRYGTGYYIWHSYVGGANLSRPIRAWDGQSAPDKKVLELLSRAGSDLLPVAGTPDAKKVGLKEKKGRETVHAGKVVTLAKLSGSATVRALEFSVPREQALEFGRNRIRITWDNRSTPSVDAPVALFFGAGTLYNDNNREYLVKAFPVHIRYSEDRVHLACYFPMPFFRSAKIELIGGEAPVKDVQWRVRHQAFQDSANHVGYFHATYKDHENPAPGHDLVLLDTKKAEGGGDWSGSFIGTSFIFSHNAALGTLEGDPRFFFDDSQTPQAYGTGTEEWGGGGDYWGGRNMTLPFAGHPTGARNAKEAKTDEHKIESAYRFLLADLMPFGKNAVIRLEHGAINDSTEHYKTVTYWYGLPAASVVKTDVLKIANAQSEKEHSYRSATASEPYEINSRYEWGPDTLHGKEVYPSHIDSGRKMTGTSEFTVKIDPKNLGVMLRRKLDYAFPNQRAEVYVAEAGDSIQQIQESNWKRAGVWYLAGANTCIYSDPKEELGATQHNVQTSNRRFRDDEFLIGRELTSGKSALRVRIKFTPVETPLFPGHPLPELAWSEIRYDVYSFVMPSFEIKK